jgi:hypothetical protein
MVKAVYLLNQLVLLYYQCIIYRIRDMYVTNIKPEESYKRSYPTYKTVRLSYKNLERIKKYNTGYHQTLDEIVTTILDKLQEFKLRGYEIKGDVQHW